MCKCASVQMEPCFALGFQSLVMVVYHTCPNRFRIGEIEVKLVPTNPVCLSCFTKTQTNFGMKVTLFSQILQKVPRDSFNSLVEQFESNKHSKGNDAWSHFGTMLFCQFAKCDSLNDIRYGIEESWKAHSDSWIKSSFTGRCCLRNAPSGYPAHVPAILN